jgi:hypothetical protein
MYRSRILRWIGVVACCVCAASWVESYSCDVVYFSDDTWPARDIEFCIGGGGLWFYWASFPKAGSKSRKEYAAEHESQYFKRVLGHWWYRERSPSLHRIDAYAPWLPKVWCYRAVGGPGSNGSRDGTSFGTSASAGVTNRIEVVLPMWVVGSALAGVAALLLWLERRARPRKGGCDVCGYDLTGNTSGICPECGTPLPEAQRASLASSGTTDSLPTQNKGE